MFSNSPRRPSCPPNFFCAPETSSPCLKQRWTSNQSTATVERRTVVRYSETNSRSARKDHARLLLSDRRAWRRAPFFQTLLSGRRVPGALRRRKRTSRRLLVTERCCPRSFQTQTMMMRLNARRKRRTTTTRTARRRTTPPRRTKGRGSGKNAQKKR